MLWWLLTDRLTCEVVGHEWEEADVRRMGSKVSGYHCERCSKTQLLLYRWQEVSADDD